MNTTKSVSKFSIEEIDQGRTLEMRLMGKLTRTDYDQMLPQLEKLMSRWPKVNFLVILESGHGWEPAAFWADLKFDVTHWKRFGRIAVVGESLAEHWATWFSSLIRSEPVRFFAPAEENVARKWVAEGGEPK